MSHRLPVLSGPDLTLALSMLRGPARDDFEFWRARLEPVLAMPKRGRTARLQEIAAMTRTPYGTVKGKFYALEKHGLAALVNRALAGPGWWETKKQVGLPLADQLLVKRYCEQNQRKTEPALRKLRRDWTRGVVRSEQPVDRRTGFPVGWSIDNLRHYAPRRFELTAMRDGLGKAIARHGPQVLTTRVGLWVGSHFVADDVKRDLKVLLLGGRGQDACIQELGVQDFFSGDRFAVHRRPQYEREDGTRDSLKEREMRFLVATILRNVGYSPRGTQWVVELGTAAIRKPLARWMERLSDGKITTRESGITGREQAIAGSIGRGGGNPRHKARLESHHNLLHNEAAHLPAATGHDRKPPEWLFGVEAQTEGVLKLIRSLPAERAAMLAVEMLEYWQALAILDDIDLEIARRTEHELEGWEQCGHTTIEMRADAASREWLALHELAALPEADARRIVAVAQADPLCRRPRKLSPREVFSRGSAELVRMPDHVIALMFVDRDLGDDLRQERRLTARGTLEIKDATIEPDTMIFEGRSVVLPDGAGTRALEEREPYQVVLNPFDRSALWVFSGAGEFLGTAARRQRACPLDQEAIRLQLGARSHTLATMLAPLQERHADAARLVAETRAHNDRVRNGDPITPAEHALADRRSSPSARKNFSRMSRRRRSRRALPHPLQTTRPPPRCNAARAEREARSRQRATSSDAMKQRHEDA